MSGARAHEQGAVLITGASSGIGEALAQVFARNGHRVILHGRSKSRLEAVACTIAHETGCAPCVLPIDLAADRGASALIEALRSAQLTPRYIVNNAGAGLFGRADKLDIDQQCALIELNCRSLTEVTLRLLPGAVAQRGGILNVGSLGGFFPGPGMAVYFATKAYVQSFTQGLREEFRDRPLHVTALCPGPVPTRFQANSGMVAARLPRLLRVDADRVALCGYAGLMRNRAVVVPGLFNLVMALGSGLIFHRASVPFVRKFHLGRSSRTARTRRNPAALPNAPLLPFNATSEREPIPQSVDLRAQPRREVGS
ncbi:MAG: SDR family oxidoreductase [Alphaproteobacteria bacterium]|nr:SDR family oxidoreductase [Alphaproteobacteria bacterium]